MSYTDAEVAIEQLTASTAATCLLLIGRDPEKANRAVQRSAAERGWREIAVGPALGSELLNLPARAQPRHAENTLRQWIRAEQGRPVALTRIDLLFEPSLKVDPLALFRNLTRSSPLLVAWPGTADANRLTYGTSGHAHVRHWKNPDVIMVTLT